MGGGRITCSWLCYMCIFLPSPHISFGDLLLVCFERNTCFLSPTECMFDRLCLCVQKLDRKMTHWSQNLRTRVVRVVLMLEIRKKCYKLQKFTKLPENCFFKNALLAFGTLPKT